MNSPKISLPFWKLIAAQGIAVALADLIWITGVLVGGFSSDYILWGLSETTIIWLISTVTVVIFVPGKCRPIATIGSLWSATSFGRFIAALGASSLLYYMAHFGLRPLLFSFLLTAVFLLIAETKVIATTISKYCLNTE
tara:strand:+ start:2011 stop:2427 length:417 start_codon:yes stop_codon:yes gene_type:complete